MEQLHKLCFSGDVGPHLTCEFIDGDAGGLPIVTLTVRCLATWDCELTTRNGEYHIIVTEPVPLVSDYVATGVVDAGTEDNEPTTLGIEVQMEGQVVESTEYAWFDLEDAPDGPIPTVTTPGPPPDWTAIHEKHCSRADSDCTANEYRELSEAKKAELEAICTAAGKPAGCGNTHVEIYGPDLVQADAEFGRLWERWEAEWDRYDEEFDRLMGIGTPFWDCIPKEQWLNQYGSGARCYLVEPFVEP